MSLRPPSFEEVLKQLRLEYAAALPHRLEDTTRTWNEFLLGGDLQPFRTLVHGLAGSGTSYGFPRISEIAGDMDSIVSSVARNGGVLGDPEKQKLGELLELLRSALDGLPVEPASRASRDESSHSPID